MQPVTSVPRWSAEPADVDQFARSLCLVGIGSAGAAVLSHWQAAAAVSCAVLTGDQLDPELTERFRAELSTALVGWRLMLAGPEAAVAQLRAEAIKAGAEETEIRVSVTSSAGRRTYCVHCARIAESDVGLGQTLPCQGCARLLRVRPHYSPRFAAYLAVADVG